MQRPATAEDLKPICENQKPEPANHWLTSFLHRSEGWSGGFTRAFLPEESRGAASRRRERASL